MPARPLIGTTLDSPSTLRNLANAILDLAAFLELSGDDVVDPDVAVKAMESLAFALKSATPDEVAAIRSAIREQVASSPSPERAAFLRTFSENVGLPQSDAA